MLDRDGTINAEKHYLSSADQLELLPDAAEGLRRLRAMGLSIAVVTNQSAIARGYFDAAALDLVHRRLEEMLKEQDASVDRFYVCPHGPDDDCPCRKPRPGLALRAAEDFQADLSRSFVIGDKDSDIELGRAVGARTILVRTGYGARRGDEAAAVADYSASNLLEAAEWIRSVITRTD